MEDYKKRKGSTLVNYLLILFILIIFGILGFLAYQSTANATFDVQKVTYSEGVINGIVKFNIKEGELIPTDSIVRISLGNETREFLLSDLTTKKTLQGSYYAEGKTILGSGEGYGVIGKKISYPVVNFDLAISQESTNSALDIPIAEAPTSSNETTSDSSGSGNIESSPIETPAEETPAESPPETPAESPPVAESTPVGSSSADSSGSPSTGATTSDSSSSDSSSSDSSSSDSSSSSSDGGGITGNVIAEAQEDYLKVSGEASKDHEFVFLLEPGQKVSLLGGSVKQGKDSLADGIVKLDKQEGKVVVTTNYQFVEEGFGEDFLGKINQIMTFDLSLLNITTPEETLTVELEYNNTTLAMASAKVYVNQSELVQQNVTRLPSENLARLKDIPNFRIKTGESLTLDLSEYFSGADSYSFIVSDMDVALTDNFATLSPVEGFKGLRKVKIFANNKFDLVESNEFEIFVSGGKINIDKSHGDVVLGQPVKWVQNISLEVPENISIQLPGSVEHVSVNSKELEIGGILDESTGGSKILLNGNVIIEVSSKQESIFYKFVRAVIKSFRSITGNAVLDSELVIDVALSDESTNYIVEYSTPGPVADETLTGRGKEVVISAPDELNYTNVLSFANISEVLRVGQENEIKILWKETGQEIPFDAYDMDGNGFLDYIEWITPHLSTQTFEIILISDASHLDSNKNFIENIYDSVSAIDDNSVVIPENDYVRVYFEKNLTSSKDITIYANAVSGTGSIEVYKKDSSELITTIADISSYAKYRELLTEMNGQSDSFDLKIIGADLEIDYITDPEVSGVCQGANYNFSCGDIVNESCNLTGSFTCNNAQDGLRVGASDIVIDGNWYSLSVAESYKGISIGQPYSNVTITNFANISVYQTALYLTDSVNNTISNIIISGNGGSGLSLSSNNNTNISNVTILAFASSFAPVILVSSNSNNFFDLSISGNYSEGISLDYSSGNNFSNINVSGIGLLTSSGVYIQNSEGNSFSGSSLYHDSSSMGADVFCLSADSNTNAGLTYGTQSGCDAWILSATEIPNIKFISPTLANGATSNYSSLQSNVQTGYGQVNQVIDNITHNLYNSQGLVATTDVQTGYGYVWDDMTLSTGFGSPHTCFILSNGNVECQGTYYFGQANNYSGGDAIQVSAGGYSTCFLLSDGKVKCQGASYTGLEEIYLNGNNAIQVSAGYDSEPCILLSDGNVLCKNYNYSSHNTVKISAGASYACFLLSNGNVECLGNNPDGRANNYTGGDAIGVESRYDFTCILLSNGNVRCQGNNPDGRANNYTSGDAIQVSVSVTTACFLLSSGNVICQGGGLQNYYGSDAVQVSTGYNSACFLLSNGNVQCQGTNNNGEANNYTGGDVKIGTPYFAFSNLSNGNYFLNATACNSLGCNSTETRGLTVNSTGNGGNSVPGVCVGVSGTVNFSCGDPVTESCTLSGDMNSTGNCLIIGGNDIIIDGSGFSLTGDGTGYGIESNYWRNTIINFANISNFGIGISWGSTYLGVVSNVTVQANNLYGLYISSAYSNNFSGVFTGNFEQDIYCGNPGLNTNTGLIYVNAVGCDSWILTSDATAPIINSFGPANGTVSNQTNVNFTLNASDNVGLANATLFIFNSLGILYNSTTVLLNGVTQATIGVVVTLVDGVYTWFWQVVDLAGNLASTQTGYGAGDRTLTVAQTGYGTQNYALTEGLVGYWPLNGNASDYSGNGNDGTENGGVIYASGKVGQAGSFDGNDDSISLGNNALFNPITGENFTLSAWIYPLSSSSTVILSHGDNSYNFYLESGTHIQFAKAMVDNTRQNSSTTPVALSQWHQVIITNTVGGNVSFYIDGAFVSSADFLYDYSYNNALSIGSTITEGMYFEGLIDEVAIWNRSLNSTEISTLYNSGNGMSLIGGGNSISSIEFISPTLANGATSNYSSLQANVNTTGTVLNTTYYLYNQTGYGETPRLVRTSTILDEGGVSVGLYHSCVLLSNGSIDCWGYSDSRSNDYASLDAIQVSAGYGHTCALLNNGDVDCWGDNTSGQSTDYSQSGYGNVPVIQISAGGFSTEEYTCFLLANGNVECQGDNTFGQANDYHGGDAIQVSSGEMATCFLKSNGNVTCQGRNDNGEAFNYTGGNAVQISAGYQHTCFLLSNRNVECHGYPDSRLYNYVGGDAIQVSAGKEHTCILLDSGEVYCQGSNAYGQSEDYFQTGYGEFVPAIQVSAGYGHTCALFNNGDVDCWGDNTSGQANNYTGGNADVSPYFAFAALANDEYLLNATACNSAGCNSTGTRSLTVNASSNGGNSTSGVCVGVSGTTNFSCGDTVTESCTLSGDMSLTSSVDCLTVVSNDKTIDGAGFSLFSNGFSGRGIVIGGGSTSGVKVQNLSLYNFITGVVSEVGTIGNNFSNIDIYLSSSSGIEEAGSYNRWTNINVPLGGGADPGINLTGAQYNYFENVISLSGSYRIQLVNSNYNSFINVNASHGGSFSDFFCTNSDTNYNLGNVSYLIQSGCDAWILDASAPNVTIIGPSNGTISNQTNVNFTLNASDNVGLANATLFIFNSLGILYNSTTVLLNGVTQATIGVVVTLVDGVYTWFWQVVDLAGNLASTQTGYGAGDRTLTVAQTGYGTQNYCVGQNYNFSCGDTVNESCTLSGNMSSTGTCFTVGVNNISINGNGSSLTGDGNGQGIYLNGNSGVNISNFRPITNFSDGIILSYSPGNNLLTNLTVSSNGNHGISVYSASNNTLSEIIANSNYIGIDLDLSSNNVLSNVTANSNGWGFALGSASNNIFSSIIARFNTQKGISMGYSSNNLFNGIALENGVVDVSCAISDSNINDGIIFVTQQYCDAWILDSSAPNVTILGPSNGTISNQTNVNFTINASDNISLANATLRIFDSFGNLYN
ncbi:hypothetical protein KA107_02205, partial [Candidatus Pacearchaeota archaeon]|nr:hypothetical protein [Candidatus Pacearchaeota archaeon]